MPYNNEVALINIRLEYSHQHWYDEINKAYHDSPRLERVGELQKVTTKIGNAYVKYVEELKCHLTNDELLQHHVHKVFAWLYCYIRRFEGKLGIY